MAHSRSVRASPFPNVFILCHISSSVWKRRHTRVIVSRKVIFPAWGVGILVILIGVVFVVIADAREDGEGEDDEEGDPPHHVPTVVDS